MDDPVRIFISYRRDDSFMRSEGDDTRDYTFIRQIKRTLHEAGFDQVFVDTDETSGIQGGEDYESRIYQEIMDCDFFIPLIGGNWLSILHAKADTGDRDILVRELRAAFAHEKAIVPLLADDATMSTRRDLPKQIRSLTRSNAISVNSNNPETAISNQMERLSQQAARERALGRG